jgi:hypothetical protein
MTQYDNNTIAHTVAAVRYLDSLNTCLENVFEQRQTWNQIDDAVHRACVLFYHNTDGHNTSHDHRTALIIKTIAARINASPDEYNTIADYSHAIAGSGSSAEHLIALANAYGSPDDAGTVAEYSLTQPRREAAAETMAAADTLQDDVRHDWNTSNHETQLEDLRKTLNALNLDNTTREALTRRIDNAEDALTTLDSYREDYLTTLIELYESAETMARHTQTA